MIKIGLIGIAALSLALASPAMARVKHQVNHQARGAVVYSNGEPNLPVENALRWGYGQGYSDYPSGFGGLYGDGRYPGNTVTYPHSYNTLR